MEHFCTRPWSSALEIDWICLQSTMTIHIEIVPFLEAHKSHCRLEVQIAK